MGNTRTLGLTLCDKKKGSTNEQQPVSQLLNVISTVTPCLGDVRGHFLNIRSTNATLPFSAVRVIILCSEEERYNRLRVHYPLEQQQNRCRC